MPPQSRGPSPEPPKRTFAKSNSLPPTLRPYLENLPSPTALIPGDQRTPTGPRMNVPDRDGATPTPTPTPTPQKRPRSTTAFQLGSDEREDNEHQMDQHSEGELVENEDDVSGVTLTDDDFESHYSRQDTSASESEDGSEEDEDEDSQDKQPQDGHDISQNGAARPGGVVPSSSDRPDFLSRVRSLPARPLPHQSHGYSPSHLQSNGLHTSQSTISLPPVPPPLYPPFYNRPPTPLPPSPSLTSLLRPPSLLNRSTTSTRPTTPDSSDVETPNDTEAAVAHSARRAHPLPPTSPKVPTYEYYGFVLYLASSLAFLIYILWSYLPSPFLHALGVTYYPNRWWSLAIPAWIVMLLVFIYVALLSYNVEYLTLPLASLECMVDEAGNVAVVDEYGRVRKGGSKRFVKELEERAKLQKEMESKGKGKGKGKGRKSSNANANSKQANRNRRRSNNMAASASQHQSQSHPRHDAPPEIPARYSSPASASAGPRPAVPQYLYSGQPDSGYSYQRGGYDNGPNHYQPSDAEYPNWRLVWNEGTDAVMDIPIGGVCEVLYGGDTDSGTF
ncbi:uncharacterized protein A1O9_09146 [Exophiala aquamarina CBS 119918]|uniref:PIG-P domain-containing protein n=1 Tax=Exophiala aquamarina CBS 119918 TaxID=1182545 RepID=A0A072P3K2_9EURO|nr:uncharacterized protein A1O9_09146 [Exophiala aquamarina CBS 119918]KEF54704.1 hypothetical protein A1O9_09146 [Exophiala aquamarina CBS 119918]